MKLSPVIWIGIGWALVVVYDLYHHDLSLSKILAGAAEVAVLGVAVWSVTNKPAIRIPRFLAGLGLLLTALAGLGLYYGGWDYRALGFVAVVGNVLTFIGYLAAQAFRPRSRAGITYIIGPYRPHA